MSCDDNHEARAKDRARRRSLPVVETPAAKGGSGSSSAPKYWRSREERDRQGPAPGAANEFAGGTFDVSPEEGGVSRRGFIQVASLSTAMAAVGAACAKPHQKIVPFVRRPEEVTPGNALHFATAFSLDGYASGLLVVSHEGRPTKVEGNPAHPQTLGATTPFEQNLVLGVYDDDRAKQLRAGARPIAWRTFLAEMAVRATHLAEGRGASLRFLTEPTTSPLLADLRRRIPSASRARSSSAIRRSPTTARWMARSWRSASPLVPRHKVAPRT